MNQYQLLDNWYCEPLGAQLAAAEKAHLANLLPTYFGYHAVQLGVLSQFNWLNISPIRHRIGITPDLKMPLRKPFIYGAFDNLPLRNDSADMLLLPHVLEFADNPQAILHDAWRVLIPDGNIILLNFNPLSLWGLRRMFNWRKIMPWGGKFLLKYRLYQMLQEIGFEIVENKTFFFQLPLLSAKTRPLLDKVGQRCWPCFGNVHLIVAKKPVVTLTPIKPRWQLQRLLESKKLAEPSTGSVKREKCNSDKMC